jgi:hypothetical protein
MGSGHGCLTANTTPSSGRKGFYHHNKNGNMRQNNSDIQLKRPHAGLLRFALDRVEVVNPNKCETRKK